MLALGTLPLRNQPPFCEKLKPHRSPTMLPPGSHQQRPATLGIKPSRAFSPSCHLNANTLDTLSKNCPAEPKRGTKTDINNLFFKPVNFGESCYTVVDNVDHEQQNGVTYVKGI